MCTLNHSLRKAEMGESQRLAGQLIKTNWKVPGSMRVPVSKNEVNLVSMCSHTGVYTQRDTHKHTH